MIFDELNEPLQHLTGVWAKDFKTVCVCVFTNGSQRERHDKIHIDGFMMCGV